MLKLLLQFTNAVLDHWAALLTGGVIVAGIALWEFRKGKRLPRRLMGWVIVLFLATAFFQAWRDEFERAKAAQEVAVDLDKRAAVANQKAINCETQLASKEARLTGSDAQVETRNKTIDVRDGQITDLQEQLSLCLVQLGKAQQREPLKIRVWEVSRPGEQPTDTVHWTTVLVVASQVVTPTRGILFCEKPFEGAEVRFLSIAPGGMFMGGDSRAIAPDGRKFMNAWTISFDSPAWTPDAPIIFSVRHSAAELGACTFQLQ